MKRKERYVVRFDKVILTPRSDYTDIDKAARCFGTFFRD